MHRNSLHLVQLGLKSQQTYQVDLVNVLANTFFFHPLEVVWSFEVPCSLYYSKPSSLSSTSSSGKMCVLLSCKMLLSQLRSLTVSSCWAGNEQVQQNFFNENIPVRIIKSGPKQSIFPPLQKIKQKNNNNNNNNKNDKLSK